MVASYFFVSIHPKARPVAAEVQRVVVVFGELQVMRGEAGVDERELFRLRVVVRRLARRGRHREVLAELVARAAAIGGVLAVADLRGHPDAANLVHHRVVGIGRIHPHLLLSEVAIRLELAAGEKRRDRRPILARRNPQHLRPVIHGIGDEQVVVADVDAVDQPVRVDARVPLVGRDLVVHERDVVAPVPHRDDDVALDAGRARRGRRHRARLDGVGPVGEHLQAARAAEAGHERAHQRCRAARVRRGGPRPPPPTGTCPDPGMVRVGLLPT